MLLGIVALPMRVRTQGTEERNKTISDKRNHELHEWKLGKSLSIVQSNQRAVLVAFGVFVSFVIKLLGIVALPMRVRTQAELERACERECLSDELCKGMQHRYK